MTTTDKAPTWAYRAGPEGVESRLFQDGNVPDGWHDSPTKCAAPEAPKPAAKKRATKDSTG